MEELSELKIEEIPLDANVESVPLGTPTSDHGGGVEFLLNSNNNTPRDNENILNELKKESEEFTLGKDTMGLNTMKNEPQLNFKHIDDINLENVESQVRSKDQNEILEEKFDILRKLENLERNKGINLSKSYSMDSSLEEMKGEYQFHIKERERKNSVQFQAKMLTTLMTGVEYLNNKFDPFDFKLDGLSEQINENIDDYEDVFSELADKYASKAKIAPELKLIFQLSSASIMVHMSNTLFKSSVPGFDDIMRQNPDIMNQFTKAATNSMRDSHPGLNKFTQQFGKHTTTDIPRDMSGPSTNIDSLLNNMQNKINVNQENDSIISAEELDNMENNQEKPKRSRRSRKTTPKNNDDIQVIV